jgi:hypothetical protein
MIKCRNQEVFFLSFLITFPYCLRNLVAHCFNCFIDSDIFANSLVDFSFDDLSLYVIFNYVLVFGQNFVFVIAFIYFIIGFIYIPLKLINKVLIGHLNVVSLDTHESFVVKTKHLFFNCLLKNLCLLIYKLFLYFEEMKSLCHDGLDNILGMVITLYFHLNTDLIS